ncbi:polynucleotide kinase- 3'-phosphatase [Aspergillus luchuensis]|uniref:Polynucleotide kinase-3'-phosphatase n=1 Tax=Aspergillus kawachii TaxID=1069201 RepID=A0A146F7Z0_ASPKA|nr:polynucleotide kinase- 3'-phosphatase [Aspergillus luchuensis]
MNGAVFPQETNPPTLALTVYNVDFPGLESSQATPTLAHIAIHPPSSSVTTVLLHMHERRCILNTNSPSNTQNPESRTLLPGIAFGDFLRRFKEPSMAEGFQDIIRVEFRFRGDETAKRLWGQYWV